MTPGYPCRCGGGSPSTWSQTEGTASRGCGRGYGVADATEGRRGCIIVVGAVTSVCGSGGAAAAASSRHDDIATVRVYSFVVHVGGVN